MTPACSRTLYKRYWFWSTSKQLRCFCTFHFETWFGPTEQLTLQLPAKLTNQLHVERNLKSVHFYADKSLKILKADRNILANNMIQYNYLFTYLITPWSRVFLEKLTGLQLVKKFPAFYGTRRFITALTSVRHLFLSWASLIQSMPTNPTSWRSILILSSHLRLGLPIGLFPEVSPQNPVHASPLPHTRYMPRLSHKE